MTKETFARLATTAIGIPAHVQVNNYPSREFSIARLYLAAPVTYGSGVRLQVTATVHGEKATAAKAIDALWEKVRSGAWTAGPSEVDEAKAWFWKNGEYVRRA